MVFVHNNDPQPDKISNPVGNIKFVLHCREAKETYTSIIFFSVRSSDISLNVSATGDENHCLLYDGHTNCFPPSSCLD